MQFAVRSGRTPQRQAGGDSPGARISTSAAYGRLGLTPIAGQNDGNEHFSQSDAQTPESLAASDGVQGVFREADVPADG